MGRTKTNLDTHYTINNQGCWIWSGGINSSGYGVMSCNRLAHRVYYEMEYGAIPNEMCVCHSCDNPICVNPEHLFVGTNQQNTADKVSKNRQAKGEKINGKLTAKSVLEILSIDKPCFAIAREYGVSDTCISLIKLGKTWKHIPRPYGYTYIPYRAPGDHTPYSPNEEFQNA